MLPSQRSDDKRNGDIVPPMPFHMRPSGMTLYVRQQIGKASLLKLARGPSVPINIKDIPKPAGKQINQGFIWGGEGRHLPLLYFVAPLKVKKLNQQGLSQ